MVWACIFTNSKPEKTNMTTFYRVRGVVYNTKRAALKALGNMQESRAIAKMIEITGHDCDASGLTRLCERGVVYKGKRLPLLDAFFIIARSVRPAIVSIDIMKIALSGKVPEDFDFADVHPFVPGTRYYEIARIRSSRYSRLPRQGRWNERTQARCSQHATKAETFRHSHRRRSRSCASNLHRATQRRRRIQL